MRVSMRRVLVAVGLILFATCATSAASRGAAAFRSRRLAKSQYPPIGSTGFSGG